MTEYFINVTKAPYNADPTGASDSWNAIQTAINSTTKGAILIPDGTYKLTKGLKIENKTSVQIQGGGAFGGTTLLFEPTNQDVNVITVSSSQHCNLSLLGIEYSGVATDGYAVVIEGDSYVIECKDIRMDYCYNGIWLKQATESRLSKIQFRYLLGDYGIRFGGGPGGCYRAILSDITANNPYPFPYPNNTSSNPTGVGNWQENTQYVKNDIVLANGAIYQCAQTGISASSGNGPTGNGGGLRSNYSLIDDNSVKWRFVSKHIIWISQDSYGYSLVIDKVALINGFIGVQMNNQSSLNHPPSWIFGNDIECDHNYYANIDLIGGEGMYITGSWFGSCLAGNAVNIIPPFLGQVSLVNSRISFAGEHGINIGRSDYTLSQNPKDILLQSNFIGGNGQKQSNTYNGIVAKGEGFIFGNNRVGRDIANPNATQHAGVFILPDTENTIVSNNDLRGNVSHAYKNNSNATSVEIHDNLS